MTKYFVFIHLSMILWEIALHALLGTGKDRREKGADKFICQNL